MGVTLTFDFVSRRGTHRAAVDIKAAVIGGWTARNKAAMEAHIHELEDLGIPRPTKTPLFYRVGAKRLTQAPMIEALGGDSSGEVEYILLKTEGALWVGLGSDHTDRKIESYSIAAAKQICDKPVGAALWPFEEVEGHWDQLILRSHIREGGSRVLYQEGRAEALLPPRELLSAYVDTSELADGTLMFGGTFGALGGVRPAPHFDCEIVDEVLGRRIEHSYDIVALPVVT